MPTQTNVDGVWTTNPIVGPWASDKSKETRHDQQSQELESILSEHMFAQRAQKGRQDIRQPKQPTGAQEPSGMLCTWQEMLQSQAS